MNIHKKIKIAIEEKTGLLVSQIEVKDNDFEAILEDESVFTTKELSFDEIDSLYNLFSKKLEIEKQKTISAKNALLDRLGITEDEAKLLLS